MATATTSKAGADGQRFVLYDIGWEGYQTLLRMLGDARSVSPTTEGMSSS